MTKQVRIENADLSNHKVLIEVWFKGVNGEPDTKATEYSLGAPTSLVTETIWKEKYLVIREVE